MQLNKIIFILSLFVSYLTLGQTHQLAESLNSKETINALAVSVDKKHNSYIVARFADTLFIGKNDFVHKSSYSNSFDGYLARFTPEGKLSWCNTIYTKGNSTVRLSNVKVINSNKILIYGIFSFTSPNAVLMLSKTNSIVNKSKSSVSKGFIANY